MKVRMVSAGIYEELALLCCFFLVGVALAASYDLLRILRGLIPHGVFVVNLEDFFYWLYVAGAVFLALYEKNDGRLRGYLFGALIFGMFLYTATFGRICVPPLIRFLQKLEQRLLRPFCAVGAVVNKKCEKSRQACGKVLSCQKKRLKKLLKTVRIGLCKR